jgi:hypothetical protein
MVEDKFCIFLWCPVGCWMAGRDGREGRGRHIRSWMAKSGARCLESEGGLNENYFIKICLNLILYI